MSPVEPDKTFTVRMPSKMAADLDREAHTYRISRNAEILRRLRWSFDAERNAKKEGK